MLACNTSLATQLCAESDVHYVRQSQKVLISI